MTDFIIIAVLAVILIAAARYVYKAKKSGVKCVGCPAGSSCCACNPDSPCACGGSCGASER